MTTHQSREARVREILEAAAAEIDERGYPNLTMDGVARRTSLSKGGVYRYFAGKREVALALFDLAFHREADFDPGEALGWGLPIVETLVRLLVHERHTEESGRWHRVLLQLFPETLHDPDFLAANEGLQAHYTGRYAELIHALIERDRPPMKPDFDVRLARALRIGTTFMQGITYRMVAGSSPEQEREPLEQFIRIILDDAMETDNE